MTDMQKLGRFHVSVPNDGIGECEMLRAAQAGCAVLRCEMLGYLRAYDIVAQHPEFDTVQPGVMVPEYDVVLEDRNGTITRQCFRRKTQ